MVPMATSQLKTLDAGEQALHLVVLVLQVEAAEDAPVVRDSPCCIWAR